MAKSFPPMDRVLGTPRSARPRVIAGLLCALGGFVVTVAALNAVIPASVRADADVALVDAAWERVAAETEVLIIGSSRVFDHLLPDVVEARLAERGHPLRCFNAALVGSFAHETDVRLRRMLRVPSPRLRFVVAELQPWAPEIYGGMRYTARTIDWHDAEATADALRTCESAPADLDAKFGNATDHLGQFAARVTGAGLVGTVASRFRDAWSGRDERVIAETVAAKSLPRSRSASATGPAPTTQSTAFDAALFRTRTAAMLAGTLADDCWGVFDRDMLTRRVDAIRAAGAEPVHFVSPTAYTFAAGLSAAAEPGMGHTLAFNRPADYPGLFDPMARFDNFHLLRPAARELSVRVADGLADLMDAAAAADRKR
ncbi:MAG: hypothetical protein K8T90_04000 [Planctomycetes bacterium]|nr:hypothetical protein [Planctomycetota bacterium]